MVDFDGLRDFALKLWDPTVNNKGLPFGSLLHGSPPRRQRSLTPPLQQPQDGFWHRLNAYSLVEPEQWTCTQEDCAFLSMLPLDIRMVVYEMVLGGMSFHLGNPNESKGGRILCFICKRSKSIDDDDHQICFAGSDRRPSSSPRDEHAEATGLLPLLVTCRQIYTEAIETLYRANTFEFWQNQYAFRFLKVMLPPQRLHCIRHFRWAMQFPHHPNINTRSQRDWSDLFSFFANETCGLQHLYLKLKRNHPMQALIRQTADEEGEGWLRPIILMAIDAHRKRGCKVEIVTEDVVHEPFAIFQGVARVHGKATYESQLRMACAEMHRRIRVSLDGRG